MKPALSLVAAEVAVIFLEPVANRDVQDGGDRNSAEACLAFQVGLEFAGQPPAVDFRFHALQCSTSQFESQMVAHTYVATAGLLTAAFAQFKMKIPSWKSVV
jgi:hypothetical protein